MIHYPMLMQRVIEGHARDHSNDVAILDSVSSITYSELADRSVELAGKIRLRAADRAADRAGLCVVSGEYSANLVVAICGALQAGSIVYPSALSCRGVFSGLAYGRVAVHASIDCASPEVDIVAGRSIADDVIVTDSVGRGERPVLVLSTSGVTGTPKHVLHSGRSLLANTIATSNLQAEALGLPTVEPRTDLTIDEVIEAFTGCQLGLRFLSGMPPWTMAGLTVLLRAILLGDTLVVPESLTPAALLRAASQERVTNASLTPFSARGLLRSAAAAEETLPDLLAIGLGGCSVDPVLAESLETAFGCLVSSGYGSTELGGPAFITKPSDAAQTRWSTVGQPVPGVEYRFEREADELLGRLVVRSPSVAMGYLAGAGPQDRFDGAWFRTDDAGYVDMAGEMRIVGRVDDLIIRGGDKIDPSLIESAARAVDGITEAIVVGLPSRIDGEQDIWLLCTAEPGYSTSEAGLRGVLVRTLPARMVPRNVRFVERLPHSIDGKLSRSNARAELLNSTAR